MKKVIFVYFLLLFVLLLMAYFIRVPLIPTDEQYYVNFARCFVGIKEHCVSRGVPFGFSFFLIPFVFIKDLSTQFTSMLFLNSFLISGVFFVAFYFFIKFQKRTLNSSIFLSSIITLLPSFFLAGKTVMTEPLFILLSGVLFLLFYGLKDKDFSYKYFLIGFLSFLLFLIRLNGVIFLILSFLYLLFFVFPKNKKALLWFLLGILPLFVLKIIVQKFVFEDIVSLYGSSLNSFVNIVFSFSWLKNVFGYFVYTCIASFFVIPLFLVEFFRKKKFDKKILLFISAFLLNIFVVSILFENGDRFDHHFYGRYIDGFLLPLILLSFDYVFLREKFKNNNLFFVFIIFFISFLLMYKPGFFERTNVYSIFPLLSFFEIFSKGGFCLGILFFSALAIVFYFFKYKKRFFIILTVICVSFSAYFLYFFEGSVGRKGEVFLPFYLNSISKENELIYVDKSIQHEYLISAYTFFLPNIHFITDYTEFQDLNHGFLISEKNLKIKNAFLLNYENHQNVALYTFDSELYNRLREENKVIIDDTINKDISLSISKLFDFSLGRARVVNFEVKNESDFPWVTYYPSRHSNFEAHDISLREYCFSGDIIVGEKRRQFDSVLFPGDSQNFFFYSLSPVCSKITYDVVQEGYKGFLPLLEIELK